MSECWLVHWVNGCYMIGGLITGCCLIGGLVIKWKIKSGIRYLKVPSLRSLLQVRWCVCRWADAALITGFVGVALSHQAAVSKVLTADSLFTITLIFLFSSLSLWNSIHDSSESLGFRCNSPKCSFSCYCHVLFFVLQMCLYIYILFYIL